MLILALSALIGTQASALNVNQLFAQVSEDSPACFVRNYNAQHMAEQPRQTVRQIKIQLKKSTFEGAEADTPPTNMLAIQVKRRGENKAWTNNIACDDYVAEEGPYAGQRSVRCGVECDGGSVEVMSFYADGGIKLKNNGVILYGGCGADEGEETIYLEPRQPGDKKNEPGSDEIFRLFAAPAEKCADVSNEAH